jgi:hypothetical protein
MKEQASSQAHVKLRAVQGHRLARNADGWPEAKVMPVTAEQMAPGPKGEPGRMRLGRGEVPAAVLRPGIALPVFGYLGAVGALIAATVVAAVAHAGGARAPMPPAGDWAALGDRLFAGEVCAVFAWFFYKLGSQRVVLGASSMRIVTWGLVWMVGRDEVDRVMLSPSALTVVLADGSKIRPSMFWSSGTGFAFVSAGIFTNFSSRRTISERIMQWRRVPASPPPGRQASARRRHWRPRPNLLLLVTLLAVIGAEAVLVTALY